MLWDDKDHDIFFQVGLTISRAPQSEYGDDVFLVKRVQRRFDPLEICSPEVCPSKTCSAEICPAKVCSTQIRGQEVCIVEVYPETGQMKISLSEVWSKEETR
jgi:hypothetical protein